MSTRDAINSPGGTALFLIIPLIWGNSFIAIKYVAKHVMPLELVSMCFVPVALCR